MTFKSFRIGLLSIILVFLYCCKEQKPVQQLEETASTQVVHISKTIKDLATFADLKLNEGSDVDAMFRFKLINPDRSASEMSSEEAIKHLKRAMSGRQSSNVVVECISTGKVILIVQGKGYGGAIWGRILYNPKNMTFEKLAFDHSAESEGYGAAMTLSSFEDQFTGIDISTESFRFGLRQNNKELLPGKILVDGLSGATKTSTSVVEMINIGLDQYSDYLQKLPINKNLEQ